MTPVLVLVGPPGAGKTTVGGAVAQRLGVAFRDTDRDIEDRVGKSIPEVFFDDGEARFRELEREAVAAALAEHRGVLALGGGAVLAVESRDALTGCPVVFLSVGLPEATRRVGLARDRPVLALNPRSQLRVLLEERQPLYEQVSTVTVPTDGRGVEEVVEVVLAVLPAAGREAGASES